MREVFIVGYGLRVHIKRLQSFNPLMSPSLEVERAQFCRARAELELSRVEPEPSPSLGFFNIEPSRAYLKKPTFKFSTI